MNSLLRSAGSDNVSCEMEHDETGSSANSPADREQRLKIEKWWQITIQVSIPFMLAGMGTIGAGVILGYVEVSNKVVTLFISLELTLLVT